MVFNVKEGTIQIDKIEMDYISFGKGKKYLIMIQGLNTNGIKGNGLMLSLMYRIFAKEYTVYLFDRRKEIYDSITIETMSDDIAKAMNYLHIVKADILGVSQGGMIAQSLAIKYPELVNKMVLALTLFQNNETVENVIKHWVELTRQDQYNELIMDMAYKMYSNSYLKKYKAFLPLLTFVQKPKDKERFIKLALSCLTCNTYERLDEIKCPVLVIGARQDQIVGCDASVELAKKLKCTIHIYEKLGHAAYEEASDFNQVVYDFLKK